MGRGDWSDPGLNAPTPGGIASELTGNARSAKIGLGVLSAEPGEESHELVCWGDVCAFACA